MFLLDLRGSTVVVFFPESSPIDDNSLLLSLFSNATFVSSS